MEPPKVNIETREERNWGELPMVQSQTKNTLNFVEVSTLPTLEDGAEVKIRARIHNCRAKGNLAFLTLR
jgi:Holliday junction resolvase-like predicted endonuclease